MGPEILVPAAIGAVSSAAMGKSPITGAVLGGVTGGVLDKFGVGSSLFDLGSKTATGAGVNLGSVATNSIDDIALPTVSSGLSTGTLGSGIQLSKLPLDSTIGAIPEAVNTSGGLLNIAMPSTNLPVSNLSNIGVQLPQSTPEMINLANQGQIKQAAPSLFDTATTYAQQNPMTVLSGGKSILDIYNQGEEADRRRLQEAVAMGNQPVRKGQSGPMSGNLLQVRRIG